MTGLGLYIHVPFCRSKCPYCGFYSIASSLLIPRWLDALKREASFYKDSFGYFDSLYLGGGTPTFLSLDDLAEILDCLQSNFRFSDDLELTIEANPCDIAHEKVIGLLSLGFNRINLGIQSLDANELNFLGRRHSVSDSENSLDILRSHGFRNIGFDLIYGLKDQSLQGWLTMLERAVALNPEHISCYQLTVEKNSLFHRIMEKGLFTELDEETGREFFLSTSGFLERHGYIHYEISNFARNEQYYSRHNCKYWNHTPYLGLGPSAHSFNNFRRWWNISSVRRYCEMLEGGKVPVEGCEDLSDEQKMLEYISMGLRTRKGLNMNRLGNYAQLSAVINKLETSGYIVSFKGRIIPTKKGFLVADQLPLYLFP